MSNGGAREAPGERQGLPALEAAVGRTIDELRRLREHAAAASRRSAELEALLGTFQSGGDTPQQMKDRLDRAEAENRDLRQRVGQALETVERLIARIQFLEDQK